MNKDQQIQVWGAAIFIVTIIVITGIAGFLSAGKSTSSSTPFAGSKTTAVTTADHTRGNLKSKVTFMEYGDFQCPACGLYDPLVTQLFKEYGDKVLFVFRNFPLYQIHTNAMISAYATESAGMQNKYWEMHEMLYAKQKEWSEGTNEAARKYIDTYAKSLGLDVAKFDIDIKSPEVAAKVQADIASGTTAHIDHTPTFFINLEQIRNPNNYAEFKSVIDGALASSTKAQ